MTRHSTVDAHCRRVEDKHPLKIATRQNEFNTRISFAQRNYGAKPTVKWAR